MSSSFCLLRVRAHTSAGALVLDLRPLLWGRVCETLVSQGLISSDFLPVPTKLRKSVGGANSCTCALIWL